MFATIENGLKEEKPSVLVPAKGRTRVFLHGFSLANLTFSLEVAFKRQVSILTVCLLLGNKQLSHPREQKSLEQNRQS